MNTNPVQTQTIKSKFQKYYAPLESDIGDYEIQREERITETISYYRLNNTDYYEYNNKFISAKSLDLIVDDIEDKFKVLNTRAAKCKKNINLTEKKIQHIREALKKIDNINKDNEDDEDNDGPFKCNIYDACECLKKQIRRAEEYIIRTKNQQLKQSQQIEMNVLNDFKKASEFLYKIGNETKKCYKVSLKFLCSIKKVMTEYLTFDKFSTYIVFYNNSHLLINEFNDVSECFNKDDKENIDIKNTIYYKNGCGDKVYYCMKNIKTISNKIIEKTHDILSDYSTVSKYESNHQLLE